MLRPCSRPLLWLGVLVISAFCTTGKAQETDTSWQTLFKRGKAAFGAMKAEEAVDLLGRTLVAIPKKPETLAQRIEAHTLRAAAFDLRNKSREALTHAKAALRLTKELHRGPGDHTWIRPLLLVGGFQVKTQDRIGALRNYEQALKISQEDAEADSNLELELEILYLLSRTQRQLSHWADAAATLGIYIKKMESKLGQDHIDLVSALAYRAKCLGNCRSWQEAIAVWEK